MKLLLPSAIILLQFACGLFSGNRTDTTPPATPTGTPALVETPSVREAPSSGPISGGILNEKALELPQPDYPAAARAVRASGEVIVTVTVDGQGSVVSATAVSGHPMLRRSAEEAAKRAKFAPAVLDGVARTVSGTLKYNFEPK